MRLKQEHKRELGKIRGTVEGFRKQVVLKEEQISELKKQIRLAEGEVSDIVAKFKKLEAQQHSVKKVDEFNALSHEMAQTEKERVFKEQRLSEAYDKLAAESDALTSLKKTLEELNDQNQSIEIEIRETLNRINEEGRSLKAQRDILAKKAEADILRTYERLLHNKRDRVVVPIENRCCSGCHITLTAQDENMVRKGERLVFCEHCSRILYWHESETVEGTAVATKQRRRRSPAKT